jgi:hypothetical protein
MRIQIHFPKYMKRYTFHQFTSLLSNFELIYMFNLHTQNKVKVITAVSDDISFAKKRLVTPRSVYTGLIDVLEYSEVDLKNMPGYEVSYFYNYCYL